MFLAASWRVRKGREGKRRAAGVCQCHLTADSGSLPWHPGASRQCTWGVIMTSAAGPAGAAHQWPSPVSPRSHERRVKDRKWNRNFWCTFYKENKRKEKKQKHKQTTNSKNYMLSRFFQSVINQSCLCSASHCLSTLASNSPLTLLMVLWLLDAAKQSSSKSPERRRGEPLNASSSSSP